MFAKKKKKTFFDVKNFIRVVQKWFLIRNIILNFVESNNEKNE